MSPNLTVAHNGSDQPAVSPPYTSTGWVCESMLRRRPRCPQRMAQRQPGACMSPVSSRVAERTSPVFSWRFRTRSYNQHASPSSSSGPGWAIISPKTTASKTSNKALPGILSIVCSPSSTSISESPSEHWLRICSLLPFLTCSEFFFSLKMILITIALAKGKLYNGIDVLDHLSIRNASFY